MKSLKATITGTVTVNYVNLALLFGPQFIPLKTVPPGLYIPDPATGKIFVHPDTLNELRKVYDDLDGERAFAI